MDDSFHIVPCASCAALNRVPLSKNLKDAKCGKCSKFVLNSKPVVITSENFRAFTEKSTLPILIDFWAEWCGPCRMMAPVLEQAAAQIETKMRIGKLDTEREQSLAANFNIRSIPTLVLFKQGKETARISGAVNLTQLNTWINQNL